eukprot:scaffold129960_cov71-Phaeocystis_antarctica.AAC.1
MAAALEASLSAFSAFSATRTSLVAAPRSGWCARSLASSGLKPRSGSATRRPRTASIRASGVQGSHMRGAPGARAAAAPAAQTALRLPSDMDDGREKHPICDKCRDEKLPTTYLCGVDYPANPGAWQLHGAFHKKLRKDRKRLEDGGVAQQQNRDAAEHDAWRAAQTGDEYTKLMAEGTRYGSQEDWRRAAKAFRGAIALRPDKPVAYYNLGTVLSNSGHAAEAAQRYLEAKERYPVGSEDWAEATAWAFDTLQLTECDEVAKPEWWNDEGLKALSARVVRAAPNEEVTNKMRAIVLRG